MRLFPLLALSCAFVAPAQAQPALQSARAIVAALPAPKTDENAQNYEGTNVAFGEELIFDGTRVPDAARLKAWRAQAASYDKNGAPSAEAWLQLEARRVALFAAPASKNAETTQIEQARNLPIPTFARAVDVLPPPSQWRVLLQLARANYGVAPTPHNAAVYAFAARLNGDVAEEVVSLRELYRAWQPRYRALMAKRGAADENGQRVDREDNSAFLPLIGLSKLLADSPLPAQQLIGLRWQLSFAPFRQEFSYFQLPNLRQKWGEAKARAFLPEVLRAQTQIQWYGAGDTADLAREVWLANPALQTEPQWELIRSGSQFNVEFALATLRKFPQKIAPPAGAANDENGPPDDEDAYQYLSARSGIISALLQRDQFERASQLMATWNRAGYINADFNLSYYDPKATPAQELKRLQWIEQTMARYPALNWWNSYRDVALRTGQTERALKRVRALLERPGQTHKGALKSALSALYLDAGEVQKGGDLLAAQVQAGTRANDDVSNRLYNLANLLRLTRVAPNAKWLEIAKNSARGVFAKTSSDYDSNTETRADIALQLSEQGQNVFAQELLATALAKALKPPKTEYYQQPEVAPYLYALTVIYYDAKRPADALYLLQNARGWGAKTLTPLLDYRGQSRWTADDHDIDAIARLRLGYLAAWALAKTGENARATQVARALLQREGGDDQTYALLVALQGQSAIPFLKQLAARDPYEERPLIWQAFLARRAGDLKSSAQLARRAIEIDPSDGEQPRGARLRAYAELATTLEKQKQIANAAELREAVSAIRLAESADKWRVAGVAPRAIALYQKSLQLFDNAYCVQSRLAVELASQGEFERAASHFERAYRLMPVSFGRLESHCFGCEGVFGNARSEPIAKRVFLQLEKAQPQNAKIAYLAGYWRMTAGQKQTATRYFERAVKLDPLYLSAWKQLRGMGEFLTPRERDAATLAVLRLDPGSHHDSYGASFEINQNFRGLWEVTAQVTDRKNPDLRANFALSGSQSEGGDYNTWELVDSPANAIARQQFVGNLSALTRN